MSDRKKRGGKRKKRRRRRRRRKAEWTVAIFAEAVTQRDKVEMKERLGTSAGVDPAHPAPIDKPKWK